MSGEKALPLLLLLALLGGCTVRDAAPAVVPTATPAPTESAAPRFTVTYELDGELLSRQSVEQGDCPTLPESGGDSRPFLGWLDESGQTIAPERIPVTGDVTYTAAFGPTLNRDTVYMSAEGGLFRPTDPLSRRECAELLYALLPSPPPEGEVVEEAAELPAGALTLTGQNLPSLQQEAKTAESGGENPRTAALAKLAGLVAAGILPEGEDAESGVGREALRRAIAPYFNEKALTAAFADVSEELTRLECARALNALLGRSGQGDWLCADMDEGEDAAAVRAACAMAESGSGMTYLSNGKLYYIQSDGRLLTDGEAEGLRFDETGVYTSGSPELDALVQSVLCRTVNAPDAPQQRLRAAYDYVRDCNVYLRGNIYERGQHGWEEAEALTLLSKHYGNCYSFAAAFWALARGLGFDARAISGYQGEHTAPHGWVWIEQEGVRYFYDVEAEYAALRDGYTWNPMFKMPWGSAIGQWLYVFDWATEGFSETT